MIRIVLIAGAAAASVGVKRLQGKQRKDDNARLGDAFDKVEDTLQKKEGSSDGEQHDLAGVEQLLVDIDAESEELKTGLGKEAGELSRIAGTLDGDLAQTVTLSEGGGIDLEQSESEEKECRGNDSNHLAANALDQKTKNGSESPTRARISEATTFAGDVAAPLVITNLPTNPSTNPPTKDRQSLSLPSSERPSIRKARVSNLRLALESASQADGFSPATLEGETIAGGTPAEGIHVDASGAGIKAPLTPLKSAPTVQSHAVLAFPTPGDIQATPNGVTSLSNANTPESLDVTTSLESIHAPPTGPKEPQSPPQPLLAVRAIPTIPSRSRSRTPRISVNAGLLDILPEGGERLWAAPAVDQPPARSSFSEGVFGALARSIPKVILPFPSKSVPSSPVGSIRAPPTPGGISKPPKSAAGSRGPSPSTPVIRAVPTGGSAPVVHGSRGRARSADAYSDAGTSVGTKADTESVVVSPIETESQQRVAQERLSRKDRWEREENGANLRVADHSADALSDGLLDEGPDSGPSNGQRRPVGTGPVDTDRHDPGMEPRSDGNGPKPNGFGRNPNGFGQHLGGADKKTASVNGWDLEGRRKALRELVAEEEKRREGLTVLEEREAELRKRLEELEGLIAERRAGDVAGGPEHVSKTGLGAEKKFDEVNFECWCCLRAGPSDATAHWYSSGEVFSYPGGQLIARLVGFEAVRARRKTARLVDELSRRLLVFVDRETGKPLSDAPGGVRTAYQHCTYRLEGSVVHTEVIIGSGENSARLDGTAGGVRVMRGAQGAVFTRPTFLSLPSENGNFLAFENQDYFTVPGAPGSEPTDHFSMVRLGPVPGFPGQCFTHVVGWKTTDLSALPAVLRDELEKEPLWKEAPEKVYH